jgi:hypothetical protein
VALLSYHTGAAAVAALLLYHINTSLVSTYRLEQFAKANGCQPIYHAHDTWVRLFTFLKMGGQDIKIIGREFDVMDDMFAEPLYKHPTLQRRVLSGGTWIKTIEPANVKAILATNFEDWEAGELRNNAFRAVMGVSIFTSN